MTKRDAKIQEYEKKIEFLEKRLEVTDEFINDLIKGDLSKIQDALDKSTRDQLGNGETTEEKTFSFLKIIIESFPFPVFIKDEHSRYLLINDFEAKLFGLDEAQIIGKQDSDLIQDEEEILIIKSSDDEVLNKNRTIELPNQKFTLSNGKSYIFKTHKIPFINPISGKKNILGFSADVTDSVNLTNLRKFIISKIINE